MRFLACFEVQPICVKRGNMPQPGGKNGQKIEWKKTDNNYVNYIEKEK